MAPNDRKYTSDHEWVKIEGNKATIGITDYAQHELGDIVFCELPEVGTAFKAGDSFAVVESVKAASEIYTFVTGTVERVNDALVDNPEKINEDAYNQFIACFKVDSLDESGLMDAAAYEAMIGA